MGGVGSTWCVHAGAVQVVEHHQGVDDKWHFVRIAPLLEAGSATASMKAGPYTCAPSGALCARVGLAVSWARDDSELGGGGGRAGPVPPCVPVAVRGGLA
jgi:hypothetical protein